MEEYMCKILSQIFILKVQESNSAYINCIHVHVASNEYLLMYLVTHFLHMNEPKYTLTFVCLSCISFGKQMKMCMPRNYKNFSNQMNLTQMLSK